MKIKDETKTDKPVEAGDFSNVVPEFGRVPDVQKYFGIKRATLYNLLADGCVKGVVMRVRGKKSGIRLIDMDSVRKYILSCAQA